MNRLRKRLDRLEVSRRVEVGCRLVVTRLIIGPSRDGQGPQAALIRTGAGKGEDLRVERLPGESEGAFADRVEAVIGLLKP